MFKLVAAVILSVTLGVTHGIAPRVGVHLGGRPGPYGEFGGGEGIGLSQGSRPIGGQSIRPGLSSGFDGIGLGSVPISEISRQGSGFGRNGHDGPGQGYSLTPGQGSGFGGSGIGGLGEGYSITPGQGSGFGGSGIGGLSQGSGVSGQRMRGSLRSGQVAGFSGNARPRRASSGARSSNPIQRRVLELKEDHQYRPTRSSMPYRILKRQGGDLWKRKRTFGQGSNENRNKEGAIEGY